MTVQVNYANKDKSQAKVEVFLLRELSDDLWEAMVKPARKVRIGNKLWFSNKISCDVIDNTISGGRVLRFETDSPSLYAFIEKTGHSPLPPYIDRKSTPEDKKYYQTVYASERGSVAIILASNSRLSYKITFISSAFSIT